MNSPHHADNLLKKGCAWKVGNDMSILASSHQWVHGITPIIIDDVPLAEAARLKVADLLVQNRSVWNIHQIYKYFIPSSARMIRTVLKFQRPC